MTTSLKLDNKLITRIYADLFYFWETSCPAGYIIWFNATPWGAAGLYSSIILGVVHGRSDDYLIEGSGALHDNINDKLVSYFIYKNT